jgi:hypothetical protein
MEGAYSPFGNRKAWIGRWNSRAALKDGNELIKADLRNNKCQGA